jgi:hypothetical protein
MADYTHGVLGKTTTEADQARTVDGVETTFKHAHIDTDTTVTETTQTQTKTDN